MKNYKQQAKKLQTKYLEDITFQKQVDLRFRKYQVLLQQSLYSDMSNINEDLFVCYNSGDYPVYFYFGMLQNCNKDNLHKLCMFFIRFFNRKPNETYTLVFINTRASSQAYGYFKQIFLQLNIDHFLNLRQFIFVRPTYYQRAQDYMSFNFFANYLRNLTVHLYSCTELCARIKINPQDFVDIVPKQIAKFQFPNLIPRKLKLEDQRINFTGQLMNQIQIAQRKQFENVMKSFLFVKHGKQTYNITDYELNKFGIPVILQILIFYFKTHPQGLKQEGLFRKSVSIDQQNQTLTQLSNKNYDCLLTISNPHIVANLIKRFLSNLKTPIIPFKQFQILMHDQGISDKKQHTKQVISSLPEINHLCLMFVLQFLRNDVISNAAFNKMTAYNIAICFAPCLLRAQKVSMADIIYASKCAITTRILLDNFQEIFADNQKIELMFRKSQQYKTEDLHKQIQNSIKTQKNQRVSINAVRLSKQNSPEIKKPSLNSIISYAHNRLSYNATSFKMQQDNQNQNIQNLRIKYFKEQKDKNSELDTKMIATANNLDFLNCQANIFTYKIRNSRQ